MENQDPDLTATITAPPQNLELTQVLWTPAPDERAIYKARKERYKSWTDQVETELSYQFGLQQTDYSKIEQLLHCRLMLMQTVP